MAVIKSQFTLRLNVEPQAKMRYIAKTQNRSLTNMIECIILDKIKEYESEHGVIILTEEETSVK